MTVSCTVSAQRIAFERVFILTGSLSLNRHIRTRQERTREPHDRVARTPKREVDRLDMVPCRLSRGHAHMARASGARVHVQKSDVCAAHLLCRGDKVRTHGEPSMPTHTYCMYMSRDVV